MSLPSLLATLQPIAGDRFSGKQCYCLATSHWPKNIVAPSTPVCLQVVVDDDGPQSQRQGKFISDNQWTQLTSSWWYSNPSHNASQLASRRALSQWVGWCINDSNVPCRVDLMGWTIDANRTFVSKCQRLRTYLQSMQCPNFAKQCNPQHSSSIPSSSVIAPLCWITRFTSLF